MRINIHTVVEDTHIFSPSFVNTFRVGFYKEKYTDGDPLYGVTPFKGDEAVAELGLQGVNPKGIARRVFQNGYRRLSDSVHYPGRYRTG